MIALPALGFLVVLTGALSSADASPTGGHFIFSYEVTAAVATEDTCPDSDHPANAHSDGHCAVACSGHVGATNHAERPHQLVSAVRRSYRAASPLQTRTEAPDPFPPRFPIHA